MKKMLAMLLSLAVIGSMALVACGGDDNKGGGDGDKDAAKIKSAALVVGNLGDKSFADISMQGLTDAANELGITVKGIEYGSDKSKLQPTLLDAAETYDMVFFSGAEGLEAIEPSADDYKDTYFVCYDVDADTVCDKSNIALLNYKQFEGDYLAGVVAATESASGVVGFVGGQEAPVINDFLVGYINGVTDTNADGKVAISFVQNYTDSAKGKELAMVQHNQNGADVLHAVAGGAGLGVLEAASEINKDGVWAIGVDADQREFFTDTKPEIADKILTSMMKRCDVSLKAIIVEVYNGNTEKFGKMTREGVAEEVTVVVENDFYKANASDETQKAVNDAKAGITDGSIKVQSGFTMPQDEFTALKNSVKP